MLTLNTDCVCDRVCAFANVCVLVTEGNGARRCAPACREASVRLEIARWRWRWESPCLWQSVSQLQ